MSTDLYFDLAATLRLAKHANNAAEHALSFSQSEAGQTRGVPALHWVADEGTYLMSNGLPGLRAQDAPERNVVVFADGWGPDSDRRKLGATEIGHDDVAGHVDLNDGTPSLLTLLRSAREPDCPWFLLNVNTETVAYRVSKTKPAA